MAANYLTSDEKQAMLRAIPRLFAHWKLTEQQSSELLGVSRETWSKIQAGHCDELLTEDQSMRASALIGTHAALRMIFTKPWCYNWPLRPNNAAFFEGQPAINVMIAGGLPTIIRVRQYLEAELAQ